MIKVFEQIALYHLSVRTLNFRRRRYLCAGDAGSAPSPARGHVPPGRRFGGSGGGGEPTRSQSAAPDLILAATGTRMTKGQIWPALSAKERPRGIKS